MGKEVLAEFATKVRTDALTARNLIEAVGDRKGSEADAAVVAFARSQGFAVTPEDVAHMRQAATCAASADGELGDTELDAVAGGIDPFTLGLGSLFVLGVAGGAVAGAGGAAAGVGGTLGVLKGMGKI